MCIFVFIFVFFSSPLSHFLCPCILKWVEFVVGCLPFSGCSSSSQNVVEEEPFGDMLQQNHSKFTFIYFSLNIVHNLKNTWLQGSSWVCPKTQIFLVEILRRELFSMFMQKVILKAVCSGSCIKFIKFTSIQLQEIYQVYLRLPVRISKIFLAGVRWSYYTNTI